MNINVSLVFKTSLFLGISDYIRWPIVFPAETLSQCSSQTRCDCNFPLLGLHCNVPSPFPNRGISPRNSMLASAVLSSCDSHPSHLESHFQKPYWLTYFLIDSWLPHIRGIAEGADVGVLLRCATKSGLGVGVRRLGEFRADDSYLPRLYR